MTGIAVRRSRLAAYMFAGLLAAIGGLLLTAMTLSGDASAASGGDLHFELHRGGRDRRHLADGRGRRRGRLDLRRFRASGRSAICCLSSTSNRSCSRSSRGSSCSARSA